MKIKSLLFLVLAACTFGLAKDKADVRDVTGCLSKGDSAKEFLLTGNDGSTWEVRSSRVPLAVSNATMHNMKEDANEAAKDSGMKKTDNEHGHLKVTAVKMVSDSCK